MHRRQRMLLMGTPRATVAPYECTSGDAGGVKGGTASRLGLPADIVVMCKTLLGKKSPRIPITPSRCKNREGCAPSVMQLH